MSSDRPKAVAHVPNSPPSATERSELVDQIEGLRESLVETMQTIHELRRKGSAPSDLQLLQELQEERRHDLDSSERELVRLDAADSLRSAERMAVAAEMSTEAASEAARWAKWAAIFAAAGSLGQLAFQLIDRLWPRAGVHP